MAGGRMPTVVSPVGVEFIASSAPEIIIQPLYDSILLSGTIGGTLSVFQQGIGTPLTFAAGFGLAGGTILAVITAKTLNWTVLSGTGAGRLGMPQTFRIERCTAWVQADAEFRQARAVVDLCSYQFIVDDKPYWKTQLRHIAGGSAPSGFSGLGAITQFNIGPADSQGGMRFPIPVGIPSQHDFRGELNFDRPINFANPLEEAVSPALTSVIKLTLSMMGAQSRAIK